MTSPNMTSQVRPIFGAALFLAVALSSANGSVHGSTGPVWPSLFEMKNVIAAVDDTKLIAIVSFQTAVVEGQKAPTPEGAVERVSLPLTAVLFGDKGECLRVAGEFSLVTAINQSQRAFRLGVVNETIPFRSKWGGDQTWHRLQPLLQLQSAKDYSPVLLLVAERDSSELLECSFFGPFSLNRVPIVIDIVKMHLAYRKTGEMPVEAPKLLKSDTFEVRIYAMAVMASEHRLTAYEFLDSSRDTPTHDFHDILLSLFCEASSNDKVADSLSDALSRYLAKVDSDSALSCLSALLNIVSTDTFGARRRLSDGDFSLKAMEVFRVLDKREDSPRKNEELRCLREILEFLAE